MVNETKKPGWPAGLSFWPETWHQVSHHGLSVGVVTFGAYTP